jgi:oligopeptide transport system substrate-binding protein
MKHKLLALLVILGLFLNTGAALAYEDRSISLPASQTALSAWAVRIATPEPISIDPALANNTNDINTTNQLFSGLTRIDPVTHTPIPDLASSWSMSPSATQFTFTLRSGIKWSNGTPITASDVRNGILRSLDPATGSDVAYMLFAIKNAAEYNDGTITDPDLVGVTVLSSTQLKFTLADPGSYFPAVLAMPVSYPVPMSTIATWGSDWTEASHIVTSGPYRLTEWVHYDHMLLDKFTSFYNASNVQIQQVSVQLVEETDAWNLFLEGSLDTVAVPVSELGSVISDPVLSPLLHTVNVPCTYYYGFSTSQPPFDDPLVRKAFIAATNRQGLLDTVFDGGNQPAQTFTPPDMFGHVDGISEGVGIPYNPGQAQQWLSNAGYPNGAGLPPVTLWYNESPGHQSTAEYIQQSWITNLNVTVTLQSLAWVDYLAQIDNGDFQIWRMGWCSDYNDAYNFLYDGIDPYFAGRFGGWSNPTYENLLDQAAQSSNNSARQLYYQQAEEILVETDAVMLPLYYNTSPVVTRAFLQRPYTSDVHIRDWQILTTTKKFTSVAAQDGWVLESAEASNKGGTLNTAATTFYLGDNAQKKQYRSLLSFSTKALPDNAVITKVTLKVKRQGVVGGGNPINAFQGFVVDLKKGFFGSALGLQASDFQATANKSYGPFKPALASGWYAINLTPAQAYINKLATNGGLTQVRLRFKLDDNNNAIANYLKLYSGNAPAASRPQLIVEYYVP